MQNLYGEESLCANSALKNQALKSISSNLSETKSERIDKPSALRFQKNAYQQVCHHHNRGSDSDQSRSDSKHHKRANRICQQRQSNSCISRLLREQLVSLYHVRLKSVRARS